MNWNLQFYFKSVSGRSAEVLPPTTSTIPPLGGVRLAETTTTSSSLCGRFQFQCQTSKECIAVSLQVMNNSWWFLLTFTLSDIQCLWSNRPVWRRKRRRSWGKKTFPWAFRILFSFKFHLDFQCPATNAATSKTALAGVETLLNQVNRNRPATPLNVTWKWFICCFQNALTDNTLCYFVLDQW